MSRESAGCGEAVLYAIAIALIFAIAGIVSLCNSITASDETRPDEESSTANNFVGVSVGHAHICAVRPWSKVECWGSNENLVGDDVGQARPPQGSFASVSVGHMHTCGVKSDGSVACWGDDSYNHQSSPPRHSLRTDRNVSYVWIGSLGSSLCPVTNVTVREAATRMGVSERRVRKLARDELVRGAVKDGAERLIPTPVEVTPGRRGPAGVASGSG